MKKEILLSLSVSLSALGAWAEVNPTDFASEVGEGTYYLYSIEAAKFMNTSVNAPSLVDYDQAQPATLTLIDGKYLISGVKDKFIKLGTYRGQYLWSDGDSPTYRRVFILSDSMHSIAPDGTTKTSLMLGKTAYSR